MPELSEIFAKRERTLKVSWGEGADDSISFRYSPDKFTTKLNAEIAAASDAESLETMAKFLVTLVTWWDITQGGVQMPINAENLERLGMPINLMISEALQNDFTLGKPKENNSSTASNGG